MIIVFFPNGVRERERTVLTWLMLISTNVFAAGCSISNNRIIVAPSLLMVTLRPSATSLSIPLGPSVVRTISATDWQALMLLISCALPYILKWNERIWMWMWGIHTSRCEDIDSFSKVVVVRCCCCLSSQGKEAKRRGGNITHWKEQWKQQVGSYTND